jgi:hypothetical protein
MRGRNRRGHNPMTRVYESNGPDVKIRGTAHHIAEKYAQLARDAQSSGDPVAAEGYLQHAEHYFRLIMAAQAQFAQQNPHQQQQPFQRPDMDGRDDFEDEGDETGAEQPNGQPFAGAPGQQMQRPQHQPQPPNQPQPQPNFRAMRRAATKNRAMRACPLSSPAAVRRSRKETAASPSRASAAIASAAAVVASVRAGRASTSSAAKARATWPQRRAAISRRRNRNKNQRRIVRESPSAIGRRSRLRHRCRNPRRR